MRAALFSGLLIAWVSLVSTESRAGREVRYQGIARDGDRIVYTEKHVVKYDDAGKLLEAKTDYVSESGAPIAELTSDFRGSLTVPTHVIRDFRTGGIEGMRRDGDKFVLFEKEPGKPERTRAIDPADSGGRVWVGCQGLNYYLLENLDRAARDEELALRFLIPGKLDSYDFALKKNGESKEGVVEFELAVQSWLLRIFAPKLHVKYDKSKKRITWYRGVSNIKSDKGSNQVVTIDYNYEGNP